MCDPLSLASAGTSLAGGFMAGADTMSAARFESAQMDLMKVLATGRSNSEVSQLMSEVTELQSNNLAAMAVSGLAGVSFAPIQEDVRRQSIVAQRRMGLNLRAEVADLEAQRQDVLIRGRSERRAAIYGGITQAAGTLYDANFTWSQAKPISHDAEGNVRLDADGFAIPETRLESVFGGSRSRVGSFFQRET